MFYTRMGFYCILDRNEAVLFSYTDQVLLCFGDELRSNVFLDMNVVKLYIVSEWGSTVLFWRDGGPTVFFAWIRFCCILNTTEVILFFVREWGSTVFQRQIRLYCIWDNNTVLLCIKNKWVPRYIKNKWGSVVYQE